MIKKPYVVIILVARSIPSRKQVVQEKQNTPNFPKKEHFLPPDTHTYVCVSGGKKPSFFGKFGVLCFS